ncbi:MAG: hypothetical protein WC979_01670 [Candidatus Pacearchaeota archaeon]|jgi:hypothetical protein|nr:hypothetical protein [Clostridia bacterium]
MANSYTHYYEGEKGDSFNIKIVQIIDGSDTVDGQPVTTEEHTTQSKNMTWKLIEGGAKGYVGFPSRPVPQKPADVVQQNDDLAKPPKNDSRIAFDPRLAKPRKGNPYADSVYALNPEEIQTTNEGGYDKSAKEKMDPNDDTTTGVPAINNWYAYLTLSGPGATKDDKKLYFDVEGERRWYETDNIVVNDGPHLNMKNASKEPTTSALIAYGQIDPAGRTPYYYSDFAFCKYWRKVPNNRLITLRRYAVPTYGSLEFPDFGPEPDKSGKTNPKPEKLNSKFLPIAQAVTWLGNETGNTMDSLMSFTVKLPWDDLQAQVDDLTEQRGDASNLPGGFLAGMGKTLSVLSGESTRAGRLHDGQTPPDPYAEGPYANRIQGPVNRIDSVKRRKPGLDFSQSISLKFHYSANSIGGINTKAAMLDIIANFLLLSYGTGSFWGGARRFRGQMQGFPWKKGMAAWYKGDPVAFYGAITESISTSVTNLSKLFDSAMSDPIGALKNLAKTGMVELVRKGGSVPLFHGYRSLLTGEPVGEWHLVIGNPLNPTMMIGNLICTGCSFSFGEELGPDDFPTEMTVTVTLDHGMSLDRAGVESMFNRGRGRIYTLPTGVGDTAAAHETAVDSKTGKGRNPYVDYVAGATAGGKPVEHKAPSFKDKDYDWYIKNGGKTYNQGNIDSVALSIKRELGYFNKTVNDAANKGSGPVQVNK